MSKKDEVKTTTEEAFSLLNGPGGTPFDDNLQMEFIDETSETAVQKSIPVIENEDSEENITAEKVETAPQKKSKEKVEESKLDEPPAKSKEKVSKKVEEESETIEKSKTEEEVEETVEEENGLHAFYSWAADEGLVEPIEDGKKVESEDDLKEVITKTINKGIEEYKSSHPEEVQKFLDYVEAGGNPRDFHRLYYEEASWKDADLENENHQEQIVRAALNKTGMDKEDIDEQINDLKDLGKLEGLAKKHLSKLIAEEDAEKESLVQAQKEYQKRQAEQAKKAWDDFRDNLYKKEEVNGFKLTPKVKDDLWNYMTKVDKKSGKTPLQIHNETNENAQILYAYLAMNNWDLSKLERQVKTKVTAELSKKLKNITDPRNKISKGSSDNFSAERGKSNMFAGFKNAIDNNLI